MTTLILENVISTLDEIVLDGNTYISLLLILDDTKMKFACVVKYCVNIFYFLGFCLYPFHRLVYSNPESESLMKRIYYKIPILANGVISCAPICTLIALIN